ncbi:MAG: SMP-30/gluconolactonase/LRE family protein [Gaiellales bacterium]
MSELAGLLDPEAELACLGSGYGFTEGPVWSTAEQALLFSDIPGDTRWRWTEAGGMEVARSPCFKANGLVLDLAGELVACDQVTSMVVRYRRDGGVDLVAFHHRGHYLNSPNDIVVRSADGALYFTDPDFGRWNDWIGQERSRLMGYRGLYRAPAQGGDGGAELLVEPDEFDQPNGLCFSPDGSLLYVNDTPRAHIKVFDVGDDGTLSGGRIFCADVGLTQAGDEDDGRSEAERHAELHNAGALDGMKCDEHGNVWVTGPRGVWVFAPDGRKLGEVPTPEVCGNLTWGGADLRTLFLMTTTTVHALRTRVGPAALPHH